MKTNHRSGKAAFTLIELMAVITIIVILAGLVVGGLGYVTEKQGKSKANVQMALLSKALEAYKLDMGNYPLTANSATGLGNSAASLYIPLFFEGYDYAEKSRTGTPPTPTNWTKRVGTIDYAKSTTIYIADLDPTTTKQGWVDSVTGANPSPPPLTTVKDPWGMEYRYRSAQPLTGTTPNALAQNPDFDLWSSGKDVLTGSVLTNKDDIKNF